jgi:hypothetical protein
MLQTEQFKLRISPEEKLMLFRLAQREERSQSDTVRKLIRDSYRSALRPEARHDLEREQGGTYATA